VASALAELGSHQVVKGRSNQQLQKELSRQLKNQKNKLKRANLKRLKQEKLTAAAGMAEASGNKADKAKPQWRARQTTEPSKVLLLEDEDDGEPTGALHVWL